MAHSVGDAVTLDGIECLIIYKADTEQSWGQYLCVDKNHDLVWYFAGEDYCDQFLTIDSAKYGYEWGGHGTATNITDQSIGAGLTNTNSLISLSLSPKNASWNVIWYMIEQFRTSVDSDKWFLPSLDELMLFNDNREDLYNLSDTFSERSYYFSSSELDANTAYASDLFKDLSSSHLSSVTKDNTEGRTRLCRYTTDAELDSTTVTITCATPDASIRYTDDGADPTESSNLYEAPLTVTPPVTIKARGYKEGYEPSDVATKKIMKPVTVPMALPDDSVLFYDRGASYGEYHIDDTGYPAREDSAEDDGSATSNNWRYLICDSANLSSDRQWGVYGTDEGLTGTAVGVGLPNTEAMLSKYKDNATYLWNLIQARRNATGGKKWFLPSKDELNIIYQNKDIIIQNGGGDLPTDVRYWSSSEASSGAAAWAQDFSGGGQNSLGKYYTYHCRALRRI